MPVRPRIGIAGCGTIAGLVHIPLLMRRADVVIAALAESDPEARVAVARMAGAPVFTTVDEMLEQAQLDAVIVALPTALHAAATRAVLAAGCDVYVEKPLASSLPDGAAVLDAWHASGRIGMMGFNARFNPLILRLRDLLRSGRAGSAVYVRSVFATASRGMPGWKRFRATGGGALLDLGAHHLDLMRFLLAREPVTVRATLESRRTEDDTALLEIAFDGGVRVHGFYSLAASEREQVEVFGDRARLSVSRFTSLDVSVTDNPGHGGLARRLARQVGAFRHLGRALRARRAPLREPGYAAALGRFLEGVRTRRLDPDAADLADGYAGLAVIDAAERSSRSGRPEPVGGSARQQRTGPASLLEAGS